MNTSRTALALATLAAVLWGAKAIAIGVAGGLDKSPAEGPLFFAGLITFVVATVAVALAATANRPAWLRAVAGFLAPVAAVALTLLVDGVVAAVAGPESERHWVWTEVNLWIQSLLLLALASAVVRGRRVRTASPSPTPSAAVGIR